MSKTKIAIQGELGAYSHIAAENLYPGIEIKTCITFEETFRRYPTLFTSKTISDFDFDFNVPEREAIISFPLLIKFELLFIFFF